VRRIIPYPSGRDLEASRSFYVEAIGLDVATDDPALCLRSTETPAAQIILTPTGSEGTPPQFGIDVGSPEAVDAVHADALRRGLRVVYPLADEHWGVRRFFVEDPGGTVISVLAHHHQRQPPSAPGAAAINRLSPRVIVRDPDRAAAFYREALGADQVFRAPVIEDGRPGVIDLRIAGMPLRVSPAVADWGWLAPDDLGGSAVLLEIDVVDPDATGERMTAHGAEVVVPIENQHYGERSGRIRDPSGHLWIITGEPR
jgi:uncharacterized glyoxalase superfamily protein PhnB